MTVPVRRAGALGLYAAAGDACAGRRLGFGLRRAALAANFARHRGGDDAAVAASWVAGALAEAGLLAVDIPEGASEQMRLLALADVPLHGAHLVAALPGVAAEAADAVRWYCEHDDGTGFPDRLRWDGIPAAAAALGIAHAFLQAVEHPDEPRDAAEALFAIEAESGRAFRIELVRAFREFIGTAPQTWDAAPEIAPPVVDEDAAIEALTARLAARAARTATPADAATNATHGERLTELARSVASELGLDADRAARLERLLAVTSAFLTGSGTPA
jgi:hypothetical protein